MNDYYIRKDKILFSGEHPLSLCVRIGKLSYDKNKFIMKDLTILKSEGFEISDDHKCWKYGYENNGKFFDMMESKRGEYMHQFESDEEALLFYEVMDYE